MAATDIREKIVSQYKAGSEDWEIAQTLGIDEDFVADVIDAFDQEQRLIA